MITEARQIESPDTSESTALAVRRDTSANGSGSGNSNGIVVHHMDDDSGPARGGIATLSAFELVQKQAMMLAHSAFVPAHLVDDKDPQRTVANCFRVAEQATRWNMSVFTVADRSYVMRGKLGFEGKLIASLINTDPRINGRLSYKHFGEGDNRTVEVSATLRGESEPRTITLSVAQAKTGNDMWKRDPDQKLVYCGALKWARRHCPELIDGILTDDDLEVIAQQPVVIDSRTAEEIAAEQEAKKAEAAAKQKAAMAAQKAAMQAQAQPTVTAPAAEAPAMITAEKKQKLVDLFRASGMTPVDLAAIIAAKAPGKQKFSDLTAAEALQVEGVLLLKQPNAMANARTETQVTTPITSASATAVASADVPAAAGGLAGEGSSSNVAAPVPAALGSPVADAPTTSTPPQAAAAAAPVVQQPVTTGPAPHSTPETVALTKKIGAIRTKLGNLWPQQEQDTWLAVHKVTMFAHAKEQALVDLLIALEKRLPAGSAA